MNDNLKLTLLSASDREPKGELGFSVGLERPGTAVDIVSLGSSPGNCQYFNIQLSIVKL